MELFKILGTIAVDNGKANEAINQTGEHAGHLSEKLGKAFSNAGKFAVAAGKTIATGLAAGATAMGKLIQASVESYADYEQLVGGVETLFKNSSAKVMEYADRAYETAGLSANDYMETVTGFSASLLQSMGNNTARAAEIADMAILDMADNANKMGTDMSSIQNAYQGFAKQNYTMLDNLKLGYGGTQQEMKRLLKDAEKISKQKYNISNLADVYSAIHVIQQEMGITGTTAKEASETISGSFSAMKASWANLLNGMSGAGDLNKLIDSFVKTSKTFVGNLTKLIPSLVKGVTGLIQGLAPQIPGMLEGILPGLLDGAVSLLSGLAMALPGLLDIITSELPNIMNQLAVAFEQVFPVLAQAIGNLFTSLVNNLPQILQSIGSIINTVWGSGIWPMIQSLFSAVFGVELPDWNTIAAKISDAWNNTIWPAISGFFKTLFEVGLPDWDTIAAAISSAWENTIYPAIQNFFSVVFGVELPDWETLKTDISTAWNTQIWPEVQNFFKATFGIEIPPFSDIVTAISGWWSNSVWPAIQNLFKAVFSVGTEDSDGKTVIQRIKDWWENVKAAIKNLFSEVFGIELPSPAGIIQSIKSWWEGIKSSLGLSVDVTVNEPSVKQIEAEKNGDNQTLQIMQASGDFVPHKTGIDFVPRDNYLARLHQGEAVLTADEARDRRNGRSGQQEVYHEEAIITGNNFYIQQESDIYDLAVELSSLRRESRRGRGARN